MNQWNEKIGNEEGLERGKEKEKRKESKRNGKRIVIRENERMAEKKIEWRDQIRMRRGSQELKERSVTINNYREEKKKKKQCEKKDLNKNENL